MRYATAVGCLTALLCCSAVHASEKIDKAQLEKVKLEDWQGKTVKLADLRSQVTVIAVWTTWCTPCIMELPYLDALFRHYQKDRRVAVLAVNIDAVLSHQPDGALRKQVQKAIGDQKLVMPMLLDTKGWLARLLGFKSPPPGKKTAMFSMPALPLLVVIDETGRLIRFTGFKSSTKKQFVDEKGKIISAALAGHLPERSPQPQNQEVMKALMMAKMGMFDQAEKILLRALAKNKNDTVLLRQLAELYRKMNKPAKALKTMNRVLTLQPENGAALNFIAYLLAEQGKDLGRAERLVRRALKNEPQNGSFLETLGWIRYRQGRYQQALETLQRADRLSPGQRTILAHIAESYLKLGRCQDAVENFRRALAADSNKTMSIPTIKVDTGR